MGIIAKLAGFSLWRFLKYIKDEILIVLGTASSESALRLLIKLERLGCAKQTVGLVLPTGYAFNLDGTSLFMAMGVMFISHAYGVPLSLDAQIGILLLLLLTSKGAATVSGGSFVVFAATVTSTGILPVEGARRHLRRLPLPVDGDRHVQHGRQQRRDGRRREVVGHVRRRRGRAPSVPRASPRHRRGRRGTRRRQPARGGRRRAQSASAGHRAVEDRGLISAPAISRHPVMIKH
jgi:hypothetical protein